MLEINNVSDNDLRRFKLLLSEPDKNGCILWLAGKDDDGYGHFKMQNKTFKAHRVAYFLHYGYIDNNLLVLHKPLVCNNPTCCNPDHLYQGSSSDNSKDIVIFGNKNGQKLSYEIAAQVREKYSQGMSVRDLVRDYQVSRSVINSILRNKYYKDDKYIPSIKRRSKGNGSIYKLNSGKYQTRLNNKHIGNFVTYEEAEKALKDLWQ